MTKVIIKSSLPQSESCLIKGDFTVEIDAWVFGHVDMFESGEPHQAA
jgi:hypothetical protein